MHIINLMLAERKAKTECCGYRIICSVIHITRLTLTKYDLLSNLSVLNKVSYMHSTTKVAVTRYPFVRYCWRNEHLRGIESVRTNILQMFKDRQQTKDFQLLW